MAAVKRLGCHARANIIAYLALFIALGGTGAYAANTIGSADVRDESLLSQDIKNGEVKTSEYADSSVGSKAIGSNAVKNDELASSVVGTGKIADGSVGSVDLGENIVTTGKLGNSSVTNAKLGYGSVTSDKLGYRAVGASQLALQEGWHYIGDSGQPGFENGWSNYNTGIHDGVQWQHAAYAVDVNNVVHIRGMVKGGTIGAPIFTLTSSYCPWFYHMAPTIAADAPARLVVSYITPTCSVSVAGAASNSYVVLDPLSYTVYYYEHTVAGASAARTSQDAPGGRRLPKTARNRR